MKGRPRGRAAVAWAALGGVAAVAFSLIIGVGVGAIGGGHHPSEAAAVASYAAAIHPLQLEAGRLVAEQIRPGLADLEAHKVTPAVFRADAAGWGAELEQVRLRLARIHPPARLARAGELYDLALRQYEAAVTAFAVASYRPASALDAAITAAVPVAEQADRTYDQADALVNATARSAGLAPPEPPGPSRS